MTHRHDDATETRLLAAARRGDRQALGELLLGCQDRIFNVCYRMCSSRDDAAELAQETMLKAIEHFDRFDGRAKLSTWLTRIAMNQTVSHLRKRRVRQAVSLDAAGTGDGMGDDQLTPLRRRLADGREPSAESRVQSGEDRSLVQSAIAELEPDLRGVIVLRDLDGMDYREIGETLEIPVGTVKSRLFRARLALRHAIERLRPTEASAPDTATDASPAPRPRA